MAERVRVMPADVEHCRSFTLATRYVYGHVTAPCLRLAVTTLTVACEEGHVTEKRFCAECAAGIMNEAGACARCLLEDGRVSPLSVLCTEDA